VSPNKLILIALYTSLLLQSPQSEAFSLSWPRVLSSLVKKGTSNLAYLKSASITKKALVCSLACIGTYYMYCGYKKIQSLWRDHYQVKEIEQMLRQLPALPEGAIGSLEAHVLGAEGRVIPVGDLHGDIQALENNIRHWQDDLRCLDKNLKLHPDYHLVFLGDLADRGPNGLAVWQKVMRLKEINPQNVRIIRGNHEERDTTASQLYGFFHELITRCDSWQTADNICQKFNQLFERLPSAIFFGQRNQETGKIEYVMYFHGGIEKRLNEHITRLLDQATKNNNAREYFAAEDLNNFECALRWGDFCATESTAIYEGPASRGFDPGHGIFVHNQAFVTDYLRQFETDRYVIKGLVRAHQHQPGGVVRLLPQAKNGSSEFERLVTRQSYPIGSGAVFTLTSSPAGLPGICNEDAFAVIEQQQGRLILTPYIWPR
jgi:hypothetical protein